jgi:hypothetical protein
VSVPEGFDLEREGMMRNGRRTSFRVPIGPAVATGALLLLAAVNPGCSCEDDTQKQTTGSTSSGGGSGTGGSGGSGGGGTAGLALQECHNDGATFRSPFDSTPSPDGEVIYFVALTPEGESGVFKAPCNSAITQLAAGEPLVSPFNIAVSTDGTSVYVVDPGAEGPNDEEGMIFKVPADGGAPTPVAGTEGTRPRGLELRDEGSGDTIYFTGIDPTDGEPGVFSIPAGGGQITAMAKGAPFRDPGGVALTADGTAYVTDTDAGEDRLANVIAVVPGEAPSVLASGIEVGFPAGVALTTDDSTVIVSAYDRSTDTDAVFFIDVASKGITPFTQGIDTFTESGGLHRAKNASVFSWCDSSAQGTGTIFVLK